MKRDITKSFYYSVKERPEPSKIEVVNGSGVRSFFILAISC